MSELSHSDRPRRLVFGEVAGLYDRARPGYPAALIDDLVTWAQPGARAICERMARFTLNAPAIPVATSRGRVVRTGAA